MRFIPAVSRVRIPLSLLGLEIFYNKVIDIIDVLLYNISRQVIITEHNGILAQLGEHLPYKQRVIGSSPIGPIYKTWRDSSVG